jgi:protein associated with RNAse G/E
MLCLDRSHTQRMITVNSRKYDGTIRKSWTCDLIEDADGLITAVGRFDSDIDHPDLGLIKAGTLSYEYFWFDRWYNIFKFVSDEGLLRNYYCNICMPPKFSNGVLDYVDLDIDVIVDAEFSYRILDENEFATNAKRYGYPAELCERVQTTLQELLDLIKSRDLPGASEVFATIRTSERESG